MRTLLHGYARSIPGSAAWVVLIVFIGIAIAAPYLSPYDPIHDRDLATPIARPGWMARFAGYSGLPVTVEEWIAPEEWEVVRATNVRIEAGEHDGVAVTQIASGGPGPGSVELRYALHYPYRPPHRFSWLTPVEWLGAPQASGEIRAFLHTADGRTLDLWESALVGGGRSYWSPPIRIDALQRTLLAPRLGLSFFDDVAEYVFNQPGQYELHLQIQLEGEEATLLLGESRMRIPGELHGLLGTDEAGADLWSQFVHGARVSLRVGLGASAIATLLGTVIGIVAGYTGRWVDELLMRFTDLTLSLPLLPVLMILAAFVGRSVWSLVVLLGLTAWMGTARLVRSATLSLRERMFVDAARSAGARPAYIMRVHILPHMSGLILASLVLLMPTAIIAESTLSFLGFGDPNVPTWGRMLNAARGAAAFSDGAWWWIVPPAFGIIALSTALVLIGNTLDDLLNRRDREV